MSEFEDGLDARTRKQLAQAGITDWRSLLSRLPIRYLDRTRTRRVADLVDGERDVVVTGTIIQAPRDDRNSPARLRDAQGDTLDLYFFHCPFYLRQRLTLGAQVALCGTVSATYDGYPRLAQPAVLTPAEIGHIVPVYRKVRGVSQETLRKLPRQAMRSLGAAGIDALWPTPPASVTDALGLVPAHVALKALHAPAKLEHLPVGLHTMKCLSLIDRRERLLARRRAREALPGAVAEWSASARRQALAQLPYALTEDQTQALALLEARLAAPGPAQALLIGGVGSGKTTVAILAAAITQHSPSHPVSVVIAPTTLLANQLAANFARQFGADQVHLGLHTKKTLPAARVYVGTHGLLNKQLPWDRVGLVVVDEEHRFGNRIKAEAIPAHPNRLYMTATPIPGTLARLLHGEMDVLTLRAPPRGRVVETRVLERHEARQAVAQVQATLGAGRKAAVVYEAFEHRPLPTVEDGFVLRGETGVGSWYPEGYPGGLVALQGALRQGQEIMPGEPVTLLPASTPLAQLQAAGPGPWALRQGETVICLRPEDLRQGDGAWLDDAAFQARLAADYYERLPLLSPARLNGGLDIQRALPMWERLAPGQVVFVHGGMKEADKQAALARFSSGETPLLVATTVIEVGIDVPALDTIVLANPNLLGLAQIEQLRGRVGRQGDTGHCLLINTGDAEDRARLDLVAATTDGMALAEADMRQRGWGAVSGSDQSGFQDPIFRLDRDYDLVARVEDAYARPARHCAPG